MTEPDVTASTLYVTTGLGIFTLIPLIDSATFLGALTGSALFTISAKDVSIPKRIAYMMISVISGYLAAPEIQANTFIQSNGVAGFLGGLFSISLSLPLLKKAQTLNLQSLIKLLKR